MSQGPDRGAEYEEYSDEYYDDGIDEEYDEPDDGVYHPPVVGGRRRKRKRFRGLPGCLAALVVLALIMGGLYVGLARGIDAIQSQFAAPDDFPGPGQGEVIFQVQEGDTIAAMGRGLKAAGVVKSVDAFTDAALAEPDANGIQVGYYSLLKEMPAADALAIMVDPNNLVQTRVTIPEGLRLTEILDLLAENTDFKRARFEKVLQNPESIGLPDYAEGNAEGYLFPSTYEFGPNDKPKQMLTMMVQRWRQSAEEADIEGLAAELGYSPHDIMTIASLIEAEGRGDDMPKISRVIYNRLDVPNDSDTNGRLEIDASVAYGLGERLGVALTQEQLDTDTPYNTRMNPGLPPGPIDSPGDDAIYAATHPAEGPWYFYVTVNLETGETRFSETYDEFLANKAVYDTYCETSEAC